VISMKSNIRSPNKRKTEDDIWKNAPFATK